MSSSTAFSSSSSAAAASSAPINFVRSKLSERSLGGFTLLLSLCFIIPCADAVANAQAPPSTRVPHHNDYLFHTYQESDVFSYLPTKTRNPSIRPTLTWGSSPVTASATQTMVDHTYSTGSGAYTPRTPEEEKSDKLLNLYFLLIALGIILICVAGWFYRKRRKSKGARAIQRGQVALRRDLEAGGWRVGGLGRWTGAPGLGGNPPAEEGLDERGEAPPPYAPPLPRGGTFRNPEIREGYSLPRIPESVVLARSAAEEVPNRNVTGPPRYDDIANIPPNARSTEAGNQTVLPATTVIVTTPPAAGTGLPAMHLASSPPPSSPSLSSPLPPQQRIGN